MFTSRRHDDVFCAILEERQCACCKEIFFRRAVAKRRKTERTLWGGRCFHPPVFYGALRRSHGLSAGGDELGSFSFRSSVSNRSLISHKKVSLATAGRGKCLQAAVTTMFSVRFWRKGNVLVANKYFFFPCWFSEGGSENEKNWANPLE